MSEAEARSAIEAKNREFERAYNSGDAAALVATYFAPDADAPMASPPGGQAPIRGRAALVQMFSAMIPDAPKIRLETLELEISGALGFELGRAHLTGRDGSSMMGRFTVCWRNTSQGWRAKIDFFAADGWN